MKRNTFWFESIANRPLAHPPDMSSNPFVKSGDIYWHCSGKRIQLWLWNSGAWEAAKLGLLRELDNRYLSLTDSGRPSWVSSKWYYRKLGQGFGMCYPLDDVLRTDYCIC